MDYSSLMRALQGSAASTRQPLNGTFELTERCNLSCRMCYVRQAAGDRAYRARELSAAKWVSLAEMAVENGMVFLLLTGGEIFLRPDFFEIYTPLTRLGLVLTLFTNGTLINDRIAEQLSEARPNRMEITLYGATARTYEAVTGTRSGYERCCAGIEALLRTGVPFSVKTTLTRGNVAEVDAMRQMARSWGVPFSAGWLLTERRDRSSSCIKSCRLSAAECVALEVTDRASAQSQAEEALQPFPDQNTENFFCQAGRAAFVVSAYGEMNVCIDLPLPQARPLEVGFTSAWKQVQDFVDHAPSLGPTCLACDSRQECPRCPAWSWAETKTFSEPVPYLCSIASARRELRRVTALRQAR